MRSITSYKLYSEYTSHQIVVQFTLRDLLPYDQEFETLGPIICYMIFFPCFVCFLDYFYYFAHYYFSH